jgi:16S rRNA (cytosine967-C5)-methyltransferase
MGENPREIAFRILTRRGSGSDYVEKLLEQELAGSPMTASDRGLCQELVFGVVRWRATLDWLVARKTKDRAQNAGIRSLLHLGLYQLFWMRVPDHAAVHETVELGKRMGFGPRAGFLNAVLRGYGREREATSSALESLKTTDPALGFSHPPLLFTRWEQRWGRDAAIALLDWDNRPPPTYARWNSLKGDVATLEMRWQKEGVDFQPREFIWMGRHRIFELLSHPPLAECESFEDGLFYIQDPSTLLAVEILDAQPGETILDLCAAPGGKTTAIAQAMGNRGHIIALDPQPARLKLLEENCLRLGANCVTPAAEAAPQLYDRILVDAPCSNTGVLRRRVDLRWRIRPSEWERLRKTQSSLLAQAVPQLKPGGVMIYSTCSLEPEENEQVVQSFLAENPTFALETKRQLTPFQDKVDGTFVARFKSLSSTAPA